MMLNSAPVCIQELSNAVIRAMNEVYVVLGPGCTVSVYRKAIEVELRIENISFESECSIPLKYKGMNISTLRADLVVEKVLIVELKSVAKLLDQHCIQCNRYLQHFDLHECILCNFPTHNSEQIEYKQIHSRNSTT